MMILFDLIANRAREISEFILLPWPEKKKRARQFWDKYSRIYILLFILTILVAIINVYMETRASANQTNARINSQKQLGGDDTKPPLQNISSNNSSSLTETETQTGKDNKPSTTETTETTAAAANINKKGSGPSENPEAKNKSSKTTINITTQLSTTLPVSSTTKRSKDKISEIKARRKEKQQQAKQSSVQDTINSIGNNLTAGISGGTGRALSVLGTFFLAILGLLLFCCTPVVIFYMWMKKLILPLFPAHNNNTI